MSRTPAEMRVAMATMAPFLPTFVGSPCSPGQPCKQQWVNPDGSAMSFAVCKREGASVAIAVEPDGAKPFGLIVATTQCRMGTPYCDVHLAIWDEMTMVSDAAVEAMRNR